MYWVDINVRFLVVDIYVMYIICCRWLFSWMIFICLWLFLSYWGFLWMLKDFRGIRFGELRWRRSFIRIIRFFSRFWRGGRCLCWRRFFFDICRLFIWLIIIFFRYIVFLVVVELFSFYRIDMVLVSR